MTDPQEPVDILVVDDQPRNILAMRAILDQPGYRCLTAASGTEALKMVMAHRFAVILLDVVMPGMDGLEVAALIKSREKSRGVPIIFLTAAGDDLDRVQKAYSLGAVDYLVKPIHPNVVRAKVEVFAELFRRSDQVERQAKQLRELDRRERERQLEELKSATERRYRDLIGAIPQLVLSAGPDGAARYFTTRWTEYTGLTPVADPAESWLDALHSADRPVFAELWRRATAGKEPFETECRIRRGADGAYLWHLLQAVPERDPSGRVIGWIGTFTDIETQKRAEVAIRRAVEARDEFLSIASHELRTPVTSLSLQVQTLARDMRGQSREPLSPAGQLRQIELAERQIGRLSSLLRALFDVSRIASGQLALDLEEVDLCSVARDVAARFAEPCSEEGSDLVVQTSGSAMGYWDAMRLEQVIGNLLSNALKYGAGRPIELRVEAGAAFTKVTVRDHGIGIAPEHHQRIFERFERAVPSASYGGLGLGLYITRSLVAAHGGSIGVESAPREGALFTVHLPTGPTPPCLTAPGGRGNLVES